MDNVIAEQLANMSPEERRALLAQLLQEEAPKPKLAPLSFAQERIWSIGQLEPDSPVFNVPFVYRIAGRLDIPVLERSLREIVCRHEILRTVFGREGEETVQIILPISSWTLKAIDLQGFPETERESNAQILIAKECEQPFDLTQDSLLRATLLQLGKEENILVLTTHQIASDGDSRGVLIREMAALYEAFLAGKPSPLPELPMQYADFARWQRQQKMLESHMAYWRERFSTSFSLLQLPTDHPRPAEQTHGAIESFVFPASLSEALKALSQKEEVSLFVTLLAAFQVLLYRYTEQEDVLVFSSTAGRDRPELKALVGLFVNLVALRTDLGGNPSFRELLGRVREIVQGAYTHQGIPFEQIVRNLLVERGAGHNTVFQVMFVLRYEPLPSLELAGLTLSRMNVGEEATEFDLFLLMADTEHGLRGRLRYKANLFDAATIGRMLGHFQTLLESIVATPDRRISDLPLLTEAEQQQMLVAWNNTRTDYARDKCIHELFEAQSTRIPEAVAAIYEDETLTYQQIDRQANQLAHHLKSLGVKPGMSVAVCLHRSLEAIPVLLGVLKAGAAYVPLDLGFPTSRLQQILTSLDVQCLVTQSSCLQTIQDLQPQLPALQHAIYVDRAEQPSVSVEEAFAPLAASVRLWSRVDVEQQPCQKPSSQVNPADLACIIFVSGPAGSPLGVKVQHRSVVNLIEWANRTFQVGVTDRVLSVTPLCFDLSVYDVFGLLAAGGAIHVVPEQDLKLPDQLLHLLCTEAITLWNSAPAVLQQLTSFFPSAHTLNGNSWLRLAFLSGDWIPLTLPDQIRGGFPNAQVVSLGGVTEATAWSYYYPIGEVAPTWTRIPCGKPIQNARCYILDLHLNPCPVGVPGNLYIGGECLSLGYVREPALTARQYVPDPFGEVPGAVMYRTGDRARFWPDGNIEFLGRLDRQVRIRGYRIELEEIEAALAQHLSVQKNVVVAREIEDASQEKCLVAYVITRDEQDLTITDLRTFLKERLPEYMIPSAFVFLKAFPLAPNGQVDWKSLPAPDQSRPGLKQVYVAPRSKAERTVAAIWAMVLHIERIGVDDNFFDLGGHSLSLVQVHSQLMAAFEREFPMTDMLKYTTVAAMATYLSQTEKQSDILQERRERAVARRSSLRQRARGRQTTEPDRSGSVVESVP